MTRTLALVALTVAARAEQFDVVVYGGTAGGVIAAIAAAREGLSAAIFEPGYHLGGMTSGGLGHTDHGNKATIGGYSLEFYRRVGKKYEQPVTWDFEPHVAEAVLKEMAAEAGVKLFFGWRLREETGVRKWKREIREIYFDTGASAKAKVFIDASYEGDLMAQSGVTSMIGRESTKQYGESLAGVRPKDRNHQFDFPVPAANANGTPFAEIQGGLRGEIGAGDSKVQAYNFRLCLTRDPANRVAFPRPRGYDPHRYDLMLAYLAAFEKNKGKAATMANVMGISELPGGKTDINNRGPFSTDFIGGSWLYPAANYETRAQIWQDHMDYTAGLFWFLANDARVPAALRNELQQWGLAADEFGDTNHWPHQLYIREARRMTGEFVMTQRDIQTEIEKPDSIGMGSYNSDSHNVQRFFQSDGTVQNEGNMEVPVKPYQIPYRVMLPHEKQVANLLVPVCVSASHVAYSTLRMEPVYMIMGHAAGVAAKLAIADSVAVQKVNAARLGERLREQKAVTRWP
ncbi:MAG: FAD-dependent oxidoreductase [Bryobacteraceae bacterium]